MVARRFAALGELTRLRLVLLLGEGERWVGSLVEATGCGQTNVSRHLRLLEVAGVLVSRREGAWVFYAVADPRVLLLRDLAAARAARPVGNSRLRSVQPAWRCAISRSDAAASHLAVASVIWSVIVLSSRLRRWKRLLSA